MQRYRANDRHRHFDVLEPGYATEACQLLIVRAFRSGAYRIYAECDPQNTASRRMLERLNFRQEGCFRQNVYFHCDAAGQPLWKDACVYAKLSQDT